MILVGTYKKDFNNVSDVIEKRFLIRITEKIIILLGIIIERYQEKRDTVVLTD